jgi:hypothetical protein
MQLGGGKARPKAAPPLRRTCGAVQQDDAAEGDEIQVDPALGEQQRAIGVAQQAAFDPGVVVQRAPQAVEVPAGERPGAVARRVGVLALVVVLGALVVQGVGVHLPGHLPRQVEGAGGVAGGVHVHQAHLGGVGVEEGVAPRRAGHRSRAVGHLAERGQPGQRRGAHLLGGGRAVGGHHHLGAHHHLVGSGEWRGAGGGAVAQRLLRGGHRCGGECNLHVGGVAAAKFKSFKSSPREAVRRGFKRCCARRSSAGSGTGPGAAGRAPVTQETIRVICPPPIRLSAAAVSTFALSNES